MRFRLAGLGALLLAAGCGADAEPARGELMLVLGTDMAVPGGVDHLRAVVLRGPEVLTRRDYELAPDGAVKLPGTLAIVAGDATPNIAIEITGFGRDADGAPIARTFARTTTTVPATRLSMLRMPAEWLCDGSALSFGGDQFTTACTAEAGTPRTCLAGECVPMAVPEASLADYDPKAVFGGGTGPKDPVARCFDVQRCFASVRLVHPDAECSVEAEASTALNFGLRVTAEDGGICDDAPTPHCTVPLDRDDVRGWRLRDDGRIQLPPAACERLESGRATLVTTEICETKSAAYPTCGPWSSISP